MLLYNTSTIFIRIIKFWGSLCCELALFYVILSVLHMSVLFYLNQYKITKVLKSIVISYFISIIGHPLITLLWSNINDHLYIIFHNIILRNESLLNDMNNEQSWWCGNGYHRHKAYKNGFCNNRLWCLEIRISILTNFLQLISWDLK